MKGKLIAYSIIAVAVFVFAFVVIPQVNAAVLSYFNYHPVKFTDNQPVTLYLREGETGSITVNAISNRNNEIFDNLRLGFDIGNYDESNLLIVPDKFPDSQLNAKGDTTGETKVFVTAKTLSSNQDNYWGHLQIYSGDKLMDKKPIKIVISQ